jgi:hypothetical protein
VSNLDYYTSERFIHDDLCTLAEASIPTLYNSWKELQKIDPFLITWPAETVKAGDGAAINGACTLELKEVPKEEWRSTILEALQLTKAYALLLVEQREHEILAILESKHGSKSWHMPIQQRGDIKVLGRSTSRADTDSLGYLWRPNKGQA